MATVVMDRRIADELRHERAVAGSDRWDEIWEGTYMMAPLPNIEHQDLVGGLLDVLREVISKRDGIVLPGTNVSDREKGWEFNYRCPDIAVYLTGTSAKNCDTHWSGGPDFGIEIASPDDMVRDKLAFYAKVGMRELLIVDRDPWSVELLRLKGRKLTPIGVSSLKKKSALQSAVLKLTFRLIPGKQRPAIEVVRATDGRMWNV